jgi:uncharacterized OsmC-like protein
MSGYDVATITVEHGPTAIGSAGPFTLVIDRPTAVGGGGRGFNGGQLLNLAVAGCISNDLFREAATEGISLRRVAVTVQSDYAGEPPVSTPIEYDVTVEGDAAEESLRRLVQHVDEIAEIPNSLRWATEVQLRTVEIRR